MTEREDPTTAQETVKARWSGIDVAGFGPYRESVAAALARRCWRDPDLAGRLVADPDLYFEETGFERGSAGRLTILAKAADEFVFVVPATPPSDELWYRYEQISNWWMLAHGFYWWARREQRDAVDPFLAALDVQIIGRCWNDPDWRERLLDDPRATLEREMGSAFSPGLRVRAIDEGHGRVLVLPPDPVSEAVDGAGEHGADLFAVAHTWWQWMIWPRLMRDIEGPEIGGMVA